MSTEQINNTKNITQNRFAKLARLGEQVFHTSDLANLWGINNKNTLYTTLKRYAKTGLIFRVYKGLYSINSLDKIDPYLLGVKALHKFAYISTETVLASAGIILQDIKYITIVSSESKKFSINNIDYRSRQLNDKFLFQDYGINTKCGVNIATIERAVADILYFNPNFYFDNPNQVDWDEVRRVQKETGYPIAPQGLTCEEGVSKLLHREERPFPAMTNNIMILPNKKDAIHRAWLYRILSAIYDNQFLAVNLYFKGGTSATMRGLLDRFSVDLDFDFIGDDKDVVKVRKELEKIFKDLGLEIKDQSKVIPQYFLKYPNKEGQRNTIKIDVATFKIKANKYEQVRLTDIDRIATCQTIETMFANKLVAIVDRYEQHNVIAGRDLYDIHYFFMAGYEYDKDVIKERRGVSATEFLNELISFIEKKITNTVINQDLNMLLSPERFKHIRKVLKKETIMFLKNEIST